METSDSGGGTPALALTFDDVLLAPGLSEVHPNNVRLGTRVTRGIELNIPLISAAMDTVTEAELAIALAQEGGIGVIHKNLSIEAQATEVDRVKRSEAGMIVNPITIRPEQRIHEALDLMARYKISGVPVTDRDGHLVGILTNRDLRFETDTNLPVSALMTHENLVTVPVGTTLDEAKAELHRHRIEKLLVTDDEGNLKGLITVKDIQKMMDFPVACKDDLGRLRVAAAVGTGGDYLDRALHWRRPRPTCSSSTPLMPTAEACWTRSSGSGRPFPTLNSWPATWRPPTARANSPNAARTDQGRHRSGQHLHDPGGHRRRNAPGDGDSRRGLGSRRSAGGR